MHRLVFICSLSIIGAACGEKDDGGDDTASAAEGGGADGGGDGGGAFTLDNLSPPYGTNAGGQELVLSGGPFPADARVRVDGRAATVLSVAADTLRFRTPAAPGTTGLVAVRVESSAHTAELPDAFTYWEDAAGTALLLGDSSVLTFSEDGASTVEFTASFAFPEEPVDLTLDEVYASALDSCTSGSGWPTIVEAVDGVLLGSVLGDVDLTYDADYGDYYLFHEADTWAGLLGSSASVEADAGLLWPEISVADALSWGTPPTVTAPTGFLTGAGRVPQDALRFQWATTGLAADFLVISLDDQYSDAVALCVVSNDGRFDVPVAATEDFDWDGGYAIVHARVYAYTRFTSDPLPWNRAEVRTISGAGVGAPLRIDEE